MQATLKNCLLLREEAKRKVFARDTIFMVAASRSD